MQRIVISFLHLTDTGVPALTTKPLLKYLFPFFFSFLFIPLLQAQKGGKIELRNANTLEFEQGIGGGAKRLLGDVALQQGNVLMYCDSAYLYEDNSLDAFGHIRIKQGDSVTIYGDFLKFYGNTRKAELKGNVRMVEKDMTLNTDVLFYDTGTGAASYTSGGKIVSKENTLTSDIGYYYSSGKELTFKKNVVLLNPDFTIYCDTMHYNTSSKVVYFKGPTNIKGKENFIYCENGWYNTNTDVARFSQKAYIVSKNQRLKGDSIYYERNSGIGKVFKNVEIIDSTQNITVKGNYAEYSEKTQQSIVTGNALLVQIYKTDTLFLHADTLKADYEENFTVKPKKTKRKNKEKNTEAAKKDTLQYRVLLAYPKVKFYRKDIQGKCDSLAYAYRDSTMRLFKDPVLWADSIQLTAEKVDIKTEQGAIKTFDLKEKAFIIAQEDSVKFNQIKGKNMKGYFKDNKLYKIDVQGNGQTLYYAKDGNKMIGVNKADCSNLMIYIKDENVERITFLNSPEATLFPMSEVNPKEFILKDFKWKANERPLSQKDIFLW